MLLKFKNKLSPKLLLTTLMSIFLITGSVFAAVTISQNIQIGSGTPDVTLDGDDMYVTGTFEVDGTSRFDATSTFNSDLVAKTGGAATFIVAANDASFRMKNQADYVADGTADNVEIQAAIDALPSVPGNTVVLSEGNFFIAAKIKIPSNTHLVINGTVHAANALNTHMFENSDTTNGNTDIVISGYGTIDGNRANQTVTSQALRFVKVTRLRILTAHIKDVKTMGIELIQCNDFSLGTLLIESTGSHSVRISESLRGTISKIYGSSTGLDGAGQVLEITRGAQDISFGLIVGRNITGGVVEIFGGVHDSDGLAATTTNIAGGTIIGDTVTEGTFQIFPGSSSVGWGSVLNISVGQIVSYKSREDVHIDSLNASGTIRRVAIGSVVAEQSTGTSVKIIQTAGTSTEITLDSLISNSPAGMGMYVNADAGEIVDVTLGEISIKGAGQHGLHLRNGKDIAVGEVIIEGSDEAGIRMFNCTDCSILGGTVRNNGSLRQWELPRDHDL